MPAPIITTTAEPVLPVRELRADEELVMTAFERHAGHCYQCNEPLAVHQEGLLLCDRGDQYATDVNKYLYSKNGKAYSAVDREWQQPTLVKIPRDCIATRELLLAIEDGLPLKHKERTQKAQQAQKPMVHNSTGPTISYDRTYHIAPRRSPVTEIIERQPRTVTRRRVIVYPSPHRGSSSHRSSSSRGSLYEADAAARVERVRETSRIHRPSEYYR
ncbi:hypothetical protein BJX76DRAFT_320364 [Aspergillus varians]